MICNGKNDLLSENGAIAKDFQDFGFERLWNPLEDPESE